MAMTLRDSRLDRLGHDQYLFDCEDYSSHMGSYSLSSACLFVLIITTTMIGDQEGFNQWLTPRIRGQETLSKGPGTIEKLNSVQEGRGQFVER
jgi:hypothetical protein